MDNSSSPEYAQLYNYLQESFKVGDVNGTGEVDEVNYDHMIEATIDAPRRGGAHKNQFASDEVLNDKFALRCRLTHQDSKNLPLTWIWDVLPSCLGSRQLW